jgi:hypothetical protein
VCIYYRFSIFASRYGGSGVLIRDAPHALQKQQGISFTGKAMLHLLRARLAPNRSHISGVENGDATAKNSGTDAEKIGAGALSKVFKLWNKDSSVGQSRAKKKLATVRV